MSLYLSEVFISAINEQFLYAVQVFDHFHIVKLMNEKLDKVLKETYNPETDKNKHWLIKRHRWLLLANINNLSTTAKPRPHKTLDINQFLTTNYYHKKSLHRVW